MVDTRDRGGGDRTRTRWGSRGARPVLAGLQPPVVALLPRQGHGRTRRSGLDRVARGGQRASIASRAASSISVGGCSRSPPGGGSTTSAPASAATGSSERHDEWRAPRHRPVGRRRVGSGGGARPGAGAGALVARRSGRGGAAAGGGRSQRHRGREHHRAPRGHRPCARPPRSEATGRAIRCNGNACSNDVCIVTGDDHNTDALIAALRSPALPAERAGEAAAVTAMLGALASDSRLHATPSRSWHRHRRSHGGQSGGRRSCGRRPRGLSTPRPARRARWSRPIPPTARHAGAVTGDDPLSGSSADNTNGADAGRVRWRRRSTGGGERRHARRCPADRGDATRRRGDHRPHTRRSAPSGNHGGRRSRRWPTAPFRRAPRRTTASDVAEAAQSAVHRADRRTGRQPAGGEARHDAWPTSPRSRLDGPAKLDAGGTSRRRRRSPRRR